MDMQILHTDKSPDRNYTVRDRLNNWTTPRQCRFLELSGWYNYSAGQRLLGHYRHYQHFKKVYVTSREDISPTLAYILDYRTMHRYKYFMAGIMSVVYSIFAPKRYYAVGRIAALNKILIGEGSTLLHEFLIGADTDFEGALTAAMARINAHDFLERLGTPKKYIFNQQINNIQQNDLSDRSTHFTDASIHNNYYDHADRSIKNFYSFTPTANFHYTDNSDRSVKTFDLSTQNDYSDRTVNNYDYSKDFSDHSLTVHPKEKITDVGNILVPFPVPQQTPLPPAPEGAQGKEKGVFSKRQILILIDLFASPDKIKFVAKKSYRLDGIAEFLHALTGKGRESWLKELSDRKNKDPYETLTPNQTDNLINIIRNLIGICQKAGLTDIATRAEKKIDDLEQRRTRQQRLPPGS